MNFKKVVESIEKEFSVRSLFPPEKISPLNFFTNNTGALHDKTLGWINFFSSKSSSCFFNSLNSAVDI